MLHAGITQSEEQALQRDLLLERELKGLRAHRDQLVQEVLDQKETAERRAETIMRDG